MKKLTKGQIKNLGINTRLLNTKALRIGDRVQPYGCEVEGEIVGFKDLGPYVEVFMVLDDGTGNHGFCHIAGEAWVDLVPQTVCAS